VALSEGGCSSAGRAPALQAGGRRFDPDQLHQFAGGGREKEKAEASEKRLLLAFSRTFGQRCSGVGSLTIRKK
jgi:hypothetical protein